MGDLHKQTIKEIWEGKEFHDFWLRMLRYGKDYAAQECRECKAYKSYIYPEDKIDDEAERIIADIESGGVFKPNINIWHVHQHFDVYYGQAVA